MAATDSVIYAIVRSIPRGRVATYGQIAELAGIPSGHRVVARAMRNCPPRLPWQRVVGKKDARRAQVVTAEDDHGSQQRALLEAEKVGFDPSGCISLREFGWQPEQRAVAQPRQARVAQPRSRASAAARPERGKRSPSQASAARSSSGRKKAGKQANMAKGKMPRRKVSASDR